MLLHYHGTLMTRFVQVILPAPGIHEREPQFEPNAAVLCKLSLLSSFCNSETSWFCGVSTSRQVFLLGIELVHWCSEWEYLELQCTFPYSWISTDRILVMHLSVYLLVKTETVQTIVRSWMANLHILKKLHHKCHWETIYGEHIDTQVNFISFHRPQNTF